MDSSRSNRIHIAAGLGAVLILTLLCNWQANAQDEPLVPLLAAPPPMKFLPGAERAQMSGTQDPKSRLKTSLALAETRLLRAEQFTVDQRFMTVTTELGVYQAIIEDVLKFLGQQKVDSNKSRDLYKRLEIQLRLHGIRIESMRRVTPATYAVHLQTIWEFADAARAKALNAFFNDTVVPPRSSDNDKTTGVDGNAGTPPTSSNSPK